MRNILPITRNITLKKYLDQTAFVLWFIYLLHNTCFSVSKQHLMPRSFLNHKLIDVAQKRVRPF